MAKGVLIYAEVREGNLSPLVPELLGVGGTLAQELGQELSAAILGSRLPQGMLQDLVAFGAQRVLVVDDPLLERYQNDPYVAALEQVVRREEPEIVLLGQTFQGRDLAPRLGFRLHTGLCMDCVELSIAPQTKNLLMVKPVYGGNARARMVCDASRPQMATIRAKAFSPAERDPTRRGEILRAEVKLDPSLVKARVLERVEAPSSGGPKLEEAKIIVSGGRGMGSAENFQPLEELAAALGGAVGASRGAVDAGYQPTERQIGLSGKVVTPDLYIAVAISGAAQHLAGCSGSKTILAINRDPDAAIFKVAQFGVVGTWQQVLPPFTEKCRELLKD